MAGDPQYPMGKARDDDEGQVGIMIGHENGMVMIAFPKPMAWIGLEPAYARQLAKLINDHADECLKEAH